MAIYEVYTSPILHRYKTTICSKASAFVTLIWLVTYISPFLLAYRSSGFWLKTDTYMEQPAVQFKHQFLLTASTGSLDALLICSTFQELNEQMQRQSRCSLVKTKELDTNMDGKSDEIDFEIELQLGDEEDVYAVNLILLFDYRLNVLCRLHMESMILIQHTSALPGARLDVVGDLSLLQRSPLLPLRGISKRYNESVFGDPGDLQSYHLPSLLNRYSARNVTTRLQNEYSMWQPGRVRDEPFILSVRLHVPEQRIEYQPGFWQVVKWAWLQYVALLCIVKTLTDKIKHWAFSNHVMPVIKLPPPWTKAF